MSDFFRYTVMGVVWIHNCFKQSCVHALTKLLCTVATAVLRDDMLICIASYSEASAVQPLVWLRNYPLTYIVLFLYIHQLCFPRSVLMCRLCIHYNMVLCEPVIWSLESHL